MTTVETQVPNLTTRREALVHRLTTFRRHVIRHLLFAGAARVIAEVVAACVLSLLVDRWLRLGLPMRMILLFAGLIALVYEVWRRIVQPLWIRQDLVGLAASIDRARKNRNGTSLAPRVATVLELPEL